MAHLSIRIPWHDNAWDGSICQHPRENTSCLILKGISKKKDDAWEESMAGKDWHELDSRLPACAAERGSFLSASEFLRETNHPYKGRHEIYDKFLPTPFRHPPFSAACIPFRWMLKEHVEGNARRKIDGLVEELSLGYSPDREPDLGDFKPDWVQEYHNQRVLLDTFFSVIRPQESLCFFYAKKTPLSESSRRVIVGVGRILHLGDPVEYEYEGGVKATPIRCTLWERNIGHSIRPDSAGDGFLLPYHQILALASTDSSIRPEEYVAFSPEAHWDEFSYTAEHVSHDAAIASLLACDSALRRTAAILPGPWAQARAWIDRELNRLWKMRGPYPGMGSALAALDIERANLIAYEIARAQEEEETAWESDPWERFEQALDKPSLLGADLAQCLGGSWRKIWKGMKPERKALLKLLSRFAISDEQAARFFQKTKREDAGISVEDSDLIRNPYLLYELDRGRVAPIQLGTIDQGVFPDAVVREKFPLPAESTMDDGADSRRIRAFVIQALENAAGLGHTLLPRDSVIRKIAQVDVRPAVPCTEDVLDQTEGAFDPVISITALKSGQPAYQLDRLVEAGNLIRNCVERRTTNAKRHPAAHPWRNLIDAAIGQGVPADASEREQEELARAEKAAALAEIYASRLTVLIGPAGTGKTTLLKALCAISDVEQGGFLLLAPTGKARVRMEAQIGLQTGKTIAQFLLGSGRFDAETGAYVVTGGSDRCTAYRTVVIDECSMLTEEQLAATLDGLENVERLVLVGDPRQLPPIGAGRPFVDIVRRLTPKRIESYPSGTPRVGPGYAELTITRRQAGEQRDDLLLANWFSGAPLDAGADEIWERLLRGEAQHIRLARWDSPEELEAKLVAAIIQDLKLSGPEDENGFEQSLGGSLFQNAVYFHPRSKDRSGAGEHAEDWQVLSPVRAGLHGVDSVNRAIQTTFRKRVLGWTREQWRRVPRPFGAQSILYGDKVISRQNGWRNDVFPPPQDEHLYVANGDIGMVVGQYKGRNAGYKGLPWKLEVEFTSQTGFKCGYAGWEFGEEGDPPLELAYALTIHRAQGSEFGITFVVVPNPCWLLSRELLYTALTRQQEHIVVFHQGAARDLIRFVSNSEIASRVTNLFTPPDLVAVQDRFMEDGLIHRTSRGDLVRSKSEVIIANLLYDKLKITNYLYENPLQGRNGSVRYPDFTLIDAETGRNLYLEHLGMLGDRVYRERWERKLAWYREQGVVPFGEGEGDAGTLLTTSEGPRGEFDVPAIEARIKQGLGVQ
ncbi:MAG: AAA family ATPase [Phycisphaerae bacterium]|nr:AAA family ATPase [Phycisphaerae bacterium]